MLWISVGILSAVVLSLGAQVPLQPAKPKISFQVTVYVFNSVQISPGDLIKAETLAASLFEKEGIRIAWRAGLTIRDMDAPPPGRTWDPADLQLRIRKSTTVRGSGVTSEAIGFCLTMEKNDAVILFDEIENRAAMLNVDPVVPLGVTMAHEMGHLLLQSASHSLTGVMKARWLAQDLMAAERGNLKFTREEGRSLRDGMERRMAVQTGLATVSAAGLSSGATPEPDTYQAFLNQGIRLQKEGHNAEAVTAYAAALSEVERRLGPQHIAAAQILINIGTLRALQHDDSGAKAALDRSLAIAERVFGPEHIQVGFTLQTIAMLTHKQGHYAAAEPLYRRALTILETKLGPEHERTVFLEASMAKLYLAQRRNSEAEALLERAIPVLEKAGAPDEATLVVVLDDLAEAYRRDGRYAKADPVFAHMLAIVEKKPADMTGDIRTGLADYVQMLRKMNRKAQARELDRQLKAMLPR
jgi:tetratricopeptide (TPR) repeat protein